MLEKFKDVIRNNWIQLIKDCNCQELAPKLVAKNVLTDYEVKEIFSSADHRHNKRLFFFKIMEKEQFAFDRLLHALSESNQGLLVKLLKGQSPVVTHSCTPTVMPVEEVPLEYEKNSEAEIQAYVNNRTAPLAVKVIHSESFQDNERNSRGVEYYYSRSKNRGRVLIINNYDFSATRLKENGHADRKGALVDQTNLEKLFNQMGGWIVEPHKNKTEQEMMQILKTFSACEENKHCDICFVIIMSHGEEELNGSTIYGIDGSYICTSNIEALFTNRNSEIYKGKPKVFIYQTCRGSDIDIAMRPVTEADGRIRKKVVANLRNMEDMLICHATLPGYRAHRDPYRGSWYIEFICDTFMRFSHQLPVDDMLSKVDQKLRKTMSEAQTMQTSEVKNLGFKKLYLNPGIYIENSVTKKYFD